MKEYIICENFFPGATSLRKEYSDAFADPRSTHAKRFVWDFWYQNEQYRHLRTPALDFFSDKKMQAFLKRLTLWGQENLGCSAISPPWLSYYVDGCYQSLHGDVPHGPFAFVFSLSSDSSALRGGKTLLLKERILDFWSKLDPTLGFESGDVLHKIENKFNDLLVFDPRVPHGVEEVKGTVDPLLARVVIHGWFTEPMPFVVGALDTESIEDSLGENLQSLFKKHPAPELSGILTLKINIAASGKVLSLKTVIDSTRGPHCDAKEKFLSAVNKIVKAWSFPKARGVSQLTLPLYFK